LTVNTASTAAAKMDLICCCILWDTCDQMEHWTVDSKYRHSSSVNAAARYFDGLQKAIQSIFCGVRAVTSWSQLQQHQRCSCPSVLIHASYFCSRWLQCIAHSWTDFGPHGPKWSKAKGRSTGPKTQAGPFTHLDTSDDAIHLLCWLRGCHNIC
jgi:hypothetical protein